VEDGCDQDSQQTTNDTTPLQHSLNHIYT